jgi:hypothetical protein
MADSEVTTTLDGLVKQLSTAGWKERDGVKARLLDACNALSNVDAVITYLEDSKKGIANLEVRWEIDEIIETLAPPVAPEPEPEPEPEEDPNKPLSASDLVLIYDDPRGLVLYKSKKGERFFATQADPNTGQPQTFELHQQEIEQLKVQLKGSPYWVLGSGEAS